MPNRRTALIAALVFVLALLAMAAYAVYEMRERPIEGAGWDTSSEGTPIGGAFELTDHTGKRVTQAESGLSKREWNDFQKRFELGES